jgi:hypothetical protein
MHIRATSHTRLRACDHYTSSTLIGGKGGPVEVRFTLRLRDQLSKWMQDGCKVRMDSCMASNGSCFMVTWTIFINPLLGGRPNTKPGDHGTLNTHNCWFILFYHAWGPTWIKRRWNSIWLRARSHMNSQYTWGSISALRQRMLKPTPRPKPTPINASQLPTLYDLELYSAV